MKKIRVLCLSAGLLLLLCLSLTLCGCQINQATLTFAVSDATIQDTPYSVGREASVKVVTTCVGGILYDSHYPHGIEGGHPALILPDGTAIQGEADTTTAVTKLFMRKGNTVEYWWSFDVPEDFPAGTYTVTVAWFGSEQAVEGVEFTMTEPSDRVDPTDTTAVPTETDTPTEDPDVQESVPAHEMFSSFDELRRLVEAVDQGEEAYAAEENDYDLEFREAQMFAEQVRELSVPVLNSAREPVRFLMDFYVEENYLDIVYIYGDDEASYYFTYYFDSVPRQRDDAILYTVTLDDISVGLFQVNSGYGGGVALGKDQFVVFIHFTGEANEAAFTLEQFDLVPLFPNAE